MVKISGFEKKITDHNHDKQISTPEFNNLAAGVFTARLAQADFDKKLQNLNRKVTSNKTMHPLVENELKKLQKFDAAYFRGKNYFGDDGRQNYLVYQLIKKYFKKTPRGGRISTVKPISS